MKSQIAQGEPLRAILLANDQIGIVAKDLEFVA